ncbi:MAG TPA: cysteine synthase A [Thermotogae bacterium]|nr:cysteine synthase [Thermotogota bacterium]HCZ06209.1 cysteine synthase A [Thermotogota bacterium]
MVISALGRTPIVTLSKLIEPGRVFVKLEKNNPAGSVKDRPAYFMIAVAEAQGLLDAADPALRTIVEPTSGNTGIALAMVGAAKGYRVILTMPESMSVERRKVLEMLGAELVLTPADEGMKGAIKKAKELVQELGAFMPDQFSNPANVLSHETTTAPEILNQMSWKLDAFVAGVGTGGTISGVGTVLKRFFGSSVLVVAVEPSRSPVLSGGEPGKHAIQGIGAGFVPSVFRREVVDRIVTIDDEEAIETTRSLAKHEGLLVGISSGANVAAALKIARELGEKARVVTVAPDHGERYLSLL